MVAIYSDVGDGGSGFGSPVVPGFVSSLSKFETHTVFKLAFRLAV